VANPPVERGESTKKRKSKRRPNPATRLKKNPKSLRLAIDAKCWDCSGGGADVGTLEEIRNCIVTLCPLWPVRPYQKKRTRCPTT
jgi:hypothetical protein